MKEGKMVISFERYNELIKRATGYEILRDAILRMPELDDKWLKNEIDSCIWFIGQKEGELNER